MWLIGGFTSDHIRQLTFTVPPLKALTLESVAKNYEKLRPEVQKLPEMDVLRRSIEGKAEMKYVIT